MKNIFILCYKELKSFPVLKSWKMEHKCLKDFPFHSIFRQTQRALIYRTTLKAQLPKYSLSCISRGHVTVFIINDLFI